VGKDTFEKSLNVLKPRGLLVLFRTVKRTGSIFRSWHSRRQRFALHHTPTLAHYIQDRGELLWRAKELFSWISDEILNVKIDRTLKLAEAGKAHELLESRKTIGKLILQP